MSPLPRPPLRIAAALGGALTVGLVAGRLAERHTHRGSRSRTLGAGDPFAGPAPDRVVAVVAGDGVSMHVEENGPDDAAATLVLVHGWTLTLESWNYQVEALAGPESRLVRYDLRGHGRSDRPDVESCTLEQLALDLLAILEDRAPTGPVVLAGHSMGGMVILALAEAHPELFGPDARIRGVGLISTSAGRLAEITFGLPALLGKVLRRADPRLFGALAAHGDRLERARFAGTDLAHSLVQRFAFGGDVPAPLVDLMEWMINQCPLSMIGAFVEDLLRHDKLAALPVLRSVPTLVLVGERDLLTPVDHSRAIAAELPRAELVVVPGAGHVVQLERPDEVNRHLAALVERAASR